MQKAVLNLLTVYFVLLLVFVIESCAVAGTVLSINQALNAPTIDGKIAEKEWNEAAGVGRFVRYGKADLETDPTALYLCFDKDNIYIAARCYQADSPVSNTHNPDASMWMDDCIEVFLQPDIEKNEYYHFISNSVGNPYDAVGRDASWNGDWTVKTSEGSGFWDIEFSIPWKTIGLDAPVGGKLIGANFTRNHPFGKSKYSGPSNIPGVVSSTWSPVRGSTFHDISTFGVLAFNENSPLAKINDLTGDPNSGLVLTAQIVNPADRDITVKGYFESNLDGVSNKDETRVSVPSGKTEDVKLQLAVSPGVYRGVYVLTDESTGDTIASQTFESTIGRPLSVRAYWLNGRVSALLDAKEFEDFIPEKCQFVLRDSKGNTRSYAGKNVDGIWRSDIDVKKMDSGDYVLTAFLSRPNATRLADQIEIVKPEKPEWYDSRLGLEDKLLPPWTPLKLSKNTVQSWGRAYDFSSGLFPVSIKSQEAELLAAPITFHAVADGKAVVLSDRSAETELTKDTRIILNRIVAGSGLEISTRSEIEYDGFIRFDSTIKSTGAKQIQSLYMDIPLKKEASSLFDADPIEPIRVGSFPYWPGGAGGPVPNEIISGPFTPHIWLGNDDIGLTWVAESQKQWANKDQNKVIEIIPQADRTILRIHYIDYPIDANEVLQYTYGLQATPIKSFAPYQQFGMYSYYGAEIKRIPRDIANNAALIYPADGNVSIDKGSVFLRLAPDFDPSRQVFERSARDPRGDADYALFSVDFPNGEQFGLYFGVTDIVFRAKATTGMNRQTKEQRVVQWRAPEWKQGESRDIVLCWGDGKISIWSNNVKVSEANYDSSVFTAPVSTARIRLGGSFTYDAVKIIGGEYNGEDIVFDSSDTSALLVDNFDNINTAQSSTLPEKSAQQSIGKLTGTWTASDGKLTLIAQKRMDSLNDLWSSSGISLMHLHETWTEAQGYPKTNKYQEEFISLNDACHQTGMRVLPYVGFQLGDNTREYQTYKEEIVVEPFVEERGWNRGDHLGQDICYAGQYQNFMLYNIDKMLSDYNIGGLYMDGTPIAPRCQNLSHGCGYYDRQGKLQPSYPIFEYRKFFKRIRTVGLSHRPDFWMDMHTTIGICTPVTGFGDSIWKGEQYTFLVGIKGGIRDLLDLDSIRAGMGKQYGIPIYFLNYDQLDDCSAVSALLDMPLRLDGGLRYRVLKYYRADSAKWVPYWQSSLSIKTTNPQTYVSYYKRKDGLILAAISNLSKNINSLHEQIAFDPEKTGFLKDSVASDAITGERFDFTDGLLNIRLTPWRYRLVLIAPESLQKPIAPGFVWHHLGPMQTPQ